MSAPQLSATVPTNQRVRLTYRIAQGVLASDGYARQAADAVTERWRASGQAVVLAPATEPVPGGTSWLGTRELFTTLDLKTNHQLPTVSWDAYLAPYRRVKVSAFDFLGAELQDVALIATSTAAGRTSATATAAGASRARSSSAAALVSTTTARLLWIAAILLVLVLVVKYGKGRA